MTKRHAVLSPSSSSRWLTCPGSIALTAEVFPDGAPDESSVYAQQGTNAHTVAELSARDAFDLHPSVESKTREWAKIRDAVADPVEFQEMLDYAEGYVELLREIAESGKRKPLLMLENRVHPSVPQVWGTADCVILQSGELYVIDFKYGKGVQVDAEDNSQLKLYALGALNLVTEVLGEALGGMDKVHAIVYQPRTSPEPQWCTYDRSELEVWQSTYAVPQANKALAGSGEIVPSDEACRWCPVAGVCKARQNQLIGQDFAEPDVMDPQELADALSRLKEIESWCTKVREIALQLAYIEGKQIPGWKVVRAKASRRIKDKQKAIQQLVKAGYDESAVSRLDTQTLATLDKLVGGKDELSKLLGDNIGTPEGKETLVPEDDPRKSISKLDDAAVEFSADAED